MRGATWVAGLIITMGSMACTDDLTGLGLDAGAGTDAGAADAGPTDARPADIGAIDDGGGVDAEPLDAEPLDAEPLDAEPLDAEPLDAEPPVGCSDPDGGAAPPPEQTVDLQLTNTGTATWFVATEGQLCATLEIETAGALRPQAFNAGPECEGPPPPPPYVAAWRAVGPGEQLGVSWDATYLGYTHYCVDCEARGFVGRGVVEVPSGIRGLAQAGTYDARLLLTRDLGASCVEDLSSPGRWTCVDAVPGAPETQGSYGMAPTCPAPAQVTSTFSLPRSGDIQVQVALP